MSSNLTGGSGNDILTGTDNGITIEGNDGNDGINEGNCVVVGVPPTSLTVPFLIDLFRLRAVLLLFTETSTFKRFVYLH
mgnify:CR=1 FL=1